jgi:hypothetical protein
MTDLPRNSGPSHDLAAQIWASPTWPLMAAMVVLGCAGMGLAHKHAHALGHPQPTMSAAATQTSSPPNVEGLTPTAFVRPHTLPATETQ